MIALSVAKLKMFSPESKKNFFVESLDQYQHLEVREKARNVFCDEPTSAWSQRVTQHCIFIKFFCNFATIFSLFLLVFHISNFWSLTNLMKQLLHSRLLNMRLVIANSMRLVGYLPSHIQRVLME